jgi:hypothetical protein
MGVGEPSETPIAPMLLGPPLARPIEPCLSARPCDRALFRKTLKPLAICSSENKLVRHDVASLIDDREDPVGDLPDGVLVKPVAE